MAAQLLVFCHAGFEVFHYGQRFMELGVKLCDSLVECILVEQTFFLQEDQGLCHGFEVVLFRPTLVADALALLQLCLNVHQFLNLIGLVCCDGLDGRSKPDVLSECGKHLLFLKLLAQLPAVMNLPDWTGSSSIALGSLSRQCHVPARAMQKIHRRWWLSSARSRLACAEFPVPSGKQSAWEPSLLQAIWRWHGRDIAASAAVPSIPVQKYGRLVLPVD